MHSLRIDDLQPAPMFPWLVASAVLVLAAAVLEGIVRSLRCPRGYDWCAFAASMGVALGRRAVDALGLSIAAPLMMWAYAHRLTHFALDGPLALLLLFLVQEFLYYWYHRASHRVRWLWASHAVHHTANDLTLAASLRLGWTSKLSGSGLFYAPLLWLGYSPRAVAGAVALNLLYQFWLHTTWIPKLGPLEWALNTPSHHRAHHGCNPEYIDCNYGGVLIVFDRWFGTLVTERDDVPPRYGLVEPLRTHNPLRLALNEWLKLGRDLARARGPRQVFATLLGPPHDHPTPTERKSP